VDLRETEGQRRFRDEVRRWLQENLPWEWGVGLPPRHDDLADEVASGREWQAKLAAERLVGVTWPADFGGRAAGPLEHFIVQEELARARAPELVGRIGVNLAGPTLLAHGSDTQKARWLPRILDASDLWCQLFSEPDAGSDLAGLRTSATRVDGGWRLNGQKVWTSYAQFADWGICLARSSPDAPKRHGITFFVVDMRAPGVEARPLVQLTGEAEFNEVFLDDVFVPDDQVVGAVDAGWRVANSTLSHERGTNPRQLVIHVQLAEELLRHALANGAWDDPRIRPRLMQAFVEVRLFQLHNWRTLSRLARGEDPGPEGSSLKLYWSEMSQRFHDVVLAVLGPAAPLQGRWQRSWLYYHGASIWAGTNEIQRTIVADRVLGLPREPREGPLGALSSGTVHRRHPRDVT
jgi:alkylation response protein AidB-like acyl-CoA dehydrogenase